MRQRNLSIIIATIGVTAANAADVRFFLAYGDAGFAAANGANMGDEMSSVSKIGTIGTSVTVQLWVSSISTSSVNYSGGCIFVGFDTATTNNSTAGYADRDAAELAGIDDMIGLDTSYNNFGAYHGQVSDGIIRPIGSAKFRGALRSGTVATLRSIGLNQNWAPSIGDRVVLEVGEKLRLADIVVRNRGILQGQVFGDSSSENGLTINSYRPASAGATFMGSITDPGNPGVDVKYQLAVVPEPTTIIAIGAGLVALAARRRKK